MLPLAQPKTKYEEMLENLNRISRSSDVNKLQLTRIKKEAEKMKKYNLAEAFALLGIISCLEHDIESMNSNHKNAIEYEDSTRMRLNYATSLINAGKYDDAYKIVIELYAKGNKENTISLDMLIQCTFFLDMHDEFNNYTKLWKELTKESHLYTTFLEDDDTHLARFFTVMDKCIEENPDEILDEFDPDLMALADDLVAGIEIDDSEE